MQTMKKALFTLLLALTSTLAWSTGPTFYYKLAAEPRPTGQGKVYVSNEDVEPDESRYHDDYYTTSTFSIPTKVQVEAVTATTYLFAKPEDGYIFTHWTKQEGNNETVISYSQKTTDLVSVLATERKNAKTTEYHAYFAKRGEVYPISSDETLGTVEIDNPSNAIGETVTITALPDKINGEFVGWQRNSSTTLIEENPLTMTVSKANRGTYTAIFKSKGIETNGIYVYIENMRSNRFLGVTGISENTLSADEGYEQRNFKNSMMLVPQNNRKVHSIPALVVKLTGEPTGTGGFRNVVMHCQGTSTYEISNQKLHVEKYDMNDYFIYGSFSGVAGYIKDNADNTTYGDVELIGSIRYPNLYNRPNNDKPYRWSFRLIDENNIDEYYFGAMPSASTTKDGKYYTTMYTAFPYACRDGVKAYVVDKIMSDGRAHLQEIANGKVPANTPVILECNGTEPAANRLLPLTTDPKEVEITNLLKGEIWLNDDSGDEANYRTAFDPSTMRVLSNDKPLFVSENNKDDVHDNAVLHYIANNTCYLDVSGIDSPKAEIEFTKENLDILLGDVNGDGKVNVIDVTLTIDYCLKNKLNVFLEENADVDFNGTINLLDVVWIINYVLEHM